MLWVRTLWIPLLSAFRFWVIALRLRLAYDQTVGVTPPRYVEKKISFLQSWHCKASLPSCYVLQLVVLCRVGEYNFIPFLFYSHKSLLLVCVALRLFHPPPCPAATMSCHIPWNTPECLSDFLLDDKPRGWAIISALEGLPSHSPSPWVRTLHSETGEWWCHVAISETLFCHKLQLNWAPAIDRNKLAIFKATT